MNELPKAQGIHYDDALTRRRKNSPDDLPQWTKALFIQKRIPIRQVNEHLRSASIRTGRGEDYSSSTVGYFHGVVT